MRAGGKGRTGAGSHPPEDMRRVFVAVPLPDAVIRQLGSLQKELRRFDFNLRWTRPETIHLTLKFLGEVPATGIEGIGAAVASAVKGHSAFRLAARGVGVFPSVRRARVLWTGLSGGTDGLQKLQSDIDRALSAIGHAPDDRRFSGHLTLGRFSGPPDPEAVLDMMKAYADYTAGTFSAEAVHVIQSDLKPGGPVYTDLNVIRLNG